MGQKQVDAARLDIATLKVSPPMECKSEDAWLVSLIYMKIELSEICAYLRHA